MPLLRRLLATALPLVVLAGCTDSQSPLGNTGSINGPAEQATLSSASPAQPVTFYGPRRFVRQTGAPQRISESISTAGFTGPFTIQVTSGDATGGARVSSATVTIDGATLLRPSDFSQARSTWTLTPSLGSTFTLDVEIAGAPGSYLEISVAGTPAGVRFCPGDATAHETMSAALDAAVAAAGGMGTVMVCNGTHTITDVFIKRGVTIRSENPGGATLVAGDIGNFEVGFEVVELPAGETVRFADLGFATATSTPSGYSVYVAGIAGHVEIDSVRFTSANGARYVMAAGGSEPTASVTVRRSSFRGGFSGLWQQAPIDMHAYDNTFDGVTSPIQFQGVTPGSRAALSEVIGNTMTNCGFNCIRGARIGNMRIEDNTVSNVVGRSVGVGIFILRPSGVVGSEPLVVRNNRVLGTGLGADRNANASYAFNNVGIQAHDESPATARNVVADNTVTSAFHGIQVVTGRFDVTNNLVAGTRWGVAVQWPQPTPTWPAGDAMFQRNDVVDAVTGYAGPALSSAGYLACNFWGSTYAPRIGGNIPGNAYAPWATAPIAGTNNSCDPATMPAFVKLCPTPDGATPMVHSMADGVKVTGNAGHLVVCNGTYPVGSVLLGDRSITIRAENALGATLDGALDFATPHATNFWINSSGSGAVTLRGFRFRNALYNNVSVQGTYGSLLIESSEFHPNQTMNYGDPLVGGSGSIGYRAGVGVYSATGAGVTVRNSAFIGGDIGFNSANAGNLRVESSSFTNQNNAAVHIGGPPTGYAGSAAIVGNTVDGCSSHWCIGVFGASSVEIIGNTLRTTSARRTGTAITVRASQAIVNDNDIAGTSVGSDRSAQSSYDARFGISFYQTASGTALRNRISRTYGGIWVDQSSATASDNVVGTTWAPIGAWGPATTSASLVANRNDFTDWVVALHGHYVMPAPNARCNWWGSAAGVTASQAYGFTPGAYTPWATAPIASTGTACTP